MLAWPFQPKQRFLVGLLSSQLFTPLQRLFFFFHVYHMALNQSPHAVMDIQFQ
jgi:hypothetical protein